MIKIFAKLIDGLTGKTHRYSDGTFIYNSPNTFLSNFHPDGRYVFHHPQEQIPELEAELVSRIEAGDIPAFKYAIKPLPDEKDPAVIVYAAGKNQREKVRRTLEELGIQEYEWRDGNPR